MGIDPVSDVIKQRTVSLCWRICKVDYAARNLFLHFPSRYLNDGFLCPGTLVKRFLSQNVSPNSVAFFPDKLYADLRSKCNDDGLVNSLEGLISSIYFIKPYGDEHMLVKVLTRPFI